MNRLILAICFCLILTHAGLASAQSPGDETSAVQARVASYLEAFNRRDIRACIEHWSESAEYIVTGSTKPIQGRAAIGEALKSLLETDEQFDLSVSDQKFRSVSPDVVMEEGTARLESTTHGVEHARYMAIHVKQAGKWYRDSIRETVIATNPATAQLGELESLVGHWKLEDETGSLNLRGKWINEKRFVSRSFEVRDKAGNKITGTEIIGWDPQAQVIRSWSFDSQGGFEQAVWSRDGQRWLVKVNAVLPNGSTGTEQRVVTSEADGNLSSEVVEQQVDGRLLPGKEKVTLVRQSTEQPRETTTR